MNGHLHVHRLAGVDTIPRFSDVQIMQAFNDCFQCRPEEINYASFDVIHDDVDILRTTRIIRDNAVQRKSDPTAIRRS